jgi:hypothetical protein
MDLFGIPCTALQLFADVSQWILGFAWIPMSWIGLEVPDVASWMNPFIPCTLT